MNASTSCTGVSETLMRTTVGTSKPESGAFGSARRAFTAACSSPTFLPLAAKRSFATSSVMTSVGIVADCNRGIGE